MKDIVFLEGILASVSSQDTQKRLKAADDLSHYISDPSNGIEFIGFDKLLDGLVSWVNSSNLKISLAGLDLLHQIVDRLGGNFRSHLLPVVPAIIERLGDSKQQVRDSAQDLLQKFMYPVSTPQHVLEQLIPAFGHKAWRVREEVLHCLVTALNLFGPSQLTISKFVPHICKLLGDPNSQVRDSAINSLVEIYRHVGEKVRIDLSKKGIPSSRLSIIYAKFDEVARSGDMVISEPDGPTRLNGETETDGAKLSTATHSRASSAKKTAPARKTSGSKTSGSSSNSASAGAVDEADFESAFDDCPDVRVHNGRELTEEMTKIQSVLSDDKNDWEHRVTALKKIRSLVKGGALEYDNFVSLVRLQEGAFKLSTKDLRSAVTREACVTLSYLSTVLRNQFDHTAESVLPTLINLNTNSAKIMATSGHVCIRFILRNTHAHRLIPILTNNLTSKSSIIRRRCCEYVDLSLREWDTTTIRSHTGIIEEAIRKGISDADSEARAGMRRAFWHYHGHFREKAESLLKSLDPSKQKQLENDRNISNLGPTKTSTSTSRYVAVKPSKPAAGSRIRSSSATSEDGAASGRHSAPSRQTVGASSRAARTSHREDSRHAVASKNSGSMLSPMAALGRSLSNIDQRSAERASTRAKTRAAVPRVSPPSHHVQQRQLRSQYSIRGAVSQPGSRSQSPERLLSTYPPRERSENYCRRESSAGRTKIPTPSVSRHPSTEALSSPVCKPPYSPASPPLSFLPVPKPVISRHLSFEYLPRRLYNPPPSFIPVPYRARTASQSSSRASSRASSRGASRDTSPDRRGDRRLSVERGYSPSHLPVLKRTSPLNNPPSVGKQLTQGESVKGVTEAAVWDAWHKSPARRKYSFGSTNSQCSDDDDSDVASISSERSYGSRGSSRNHHHKVLEAGTEVAEIVRLTNCNVWSDRRDGVLCLQAFLRNSGILGQIELGRIKECLTRLFIDPHNKVYSLFLDALCEFIVVNKVDLHDWLFVLLSRLLSKLGTELLSSLQSKVVRVLDVIRDSFPYDLQFSILTRFITDQTQTPNLKVKIAILQYLQGLIGLMDPSDFTNSGETRLAVSRIITWTTEPKSADVRKESAAVIVALFELNTPEFSMMLTVLPKSFQDGATKLLHNHLKSSSQGNEPFAAGRGSPSSSSSNFDDVDSMSSSVERPRLRLGYRTLSSSSMKGISPTKDENRAENPTSPDHHTKIPTPQKTVQSPRNQAKYGLPPRSSSRENSGRAEALSSSESLEGRYASPPHPSRGEGAAHQPEDAPSVSSGYNSDDVTSGHVENHPSPPPPASVVSLSGPAGHEYDPRQYQDQQNDFHPVPEMNGFLTAGRKKNGVVEDELDQSLEGMDHSDDQFDKDVSLENVHPLTPLLVPLGAPSGEQSERKREALGELLKMAREETPELWEESFETLFSLILKNVTDEEPAVRLLSLRVLRDLVRTKPHAFGEKNGKMIEVVLHAHKDPQKEVVRVAEEAAGTIAKSIPPESCLEALAPVLRDAEFPINLAALKMTNKVVEDVDNDTVEENLGELVPGLIRCYDHVESSVRKASVFCLVAIHGAVGEEVLMPHLAELSGTKMKLLNLYIKRSQAGNGGARP